MLLKAISVGPLVVLENISVKESIWPARRMKVRLNPTPSLRFVNQAVLLYTPKGRFVALKLRLKVTAAEGPPGSSVPPPEEAVSQDEVFARDQGSEWLHELVSVKLIELGVYGPPRGPEAVIPAAGVMLRASGTSKAATTPVVVELTGAVALDPMPRLANAAQMSAW